ncbi:MAG TPA: hypothetical protein H9896_07870 [Candidatus Pygmaiobacter gallistercoris]|nr:hypothetical protein [Candidatus Pygmaiobacter gallistercoris]
MGYYRRYLVYYFLAAFAEAGLWLLTVGTIYQPGVVFLIVAFFATAILCNLLGVLRYRKSINRALRGGDIAAFLEENRRRIRRSIKKVRPILQLNQVWALTLAGRFDEADKLFSEIRPSQKGRKRDLLTEQLTFAMRGAGLAICQDRLADADAQLEQLRRQLRQLSSGDTLFTHYEKALQDLTAQRMVRGGGGTEYRSYFENQAQSSEDKVPQGIGSFYLGLARENAGDTAGALASYRTAQQLLPDLWPGRAAAERAAQLEQD